MSPLLKKRSDIKSKAITKYCLMSAVFALVIMIFTYFCHSNTLTFGDDTVLRMDLYHQYGPLYSELYDRLVNGESLVYSWTSGLGGGFLGNLFNYCCSPFALIILLCGHVNMPEAIAIMILLKAVMSSVTFTYFLNKSNEAPDSMSVSFGLLYAFCGYFVAYSWNIMWLDAMAIFPLVMLGIEKIIKDRKPGLYLFALTYTMITNYYMAYMVCILSVVYFLFYYFGRYDFFTKIREEIVAVPVTPEPIPEQEEPVVEKAVNKKKKKKLSERIGNSRFVYSGLVFAGASVLSFMLAAFALIPVAYSLKSCSATSSTFPETLKVYFNFFDFIANHLPAVNTTIRSSGDIVLPNIYCGILTVILVPFYFMSNRISGRQKIAAVSVIGFFYLAFSINYLNYIMHGMHFPNDLPYRFSFAYSFVLLTLVYRVVKEREEFSKKEYVVAGMALFAFVFLVDKLGSTNVESKTIYLSLVFAIIYIVILGLSTSKNYPKRIVSILLSFIIVLELCFCNTGNYIMSQPKANYTSDYDDYQQISEFAEENDDTLFYRTELTKLRARMDPSWYGYNGVSVFSSMAYESTSNLMKSLGLFGNNINSYTYYPQTPIFNSFFALRYLYDNSDYLNENEYYDFVGSNEVYEAYKYNYSLPLGFTVSDNITDWDYSSDNPFTVQNNLVSSSTGIDDVMIPVEATGVDIDNLRSLDVASVNCDTSFYVEKNEKSKEATAKVIIDVTETGDYYIYAGSTKLSRLQINAGEFAFDYVSSSIQPLTIGVGTQEAGSQIVVEFTIDESYDSAYITFCAAKTDDEKFKKAYETICSKGLLELNEFNETEFSGTVNVTEDNSFFFTSVPYDESWIVYVDGVKLDYNDRDSGIYEEGKITAVGNGLIGFSLTKGEHNIEFVYEARGLTKGIFITIAGIIILAAYIIISIIRKKKKSGIASEPLVESTNSDFSENDMHSFADDSREVIDAEIDYSFPSENTEETNIDVNTDSESAESDNLTPENENNNENL